MKAVTHHTPDPGRLPPQVVESLQALLPVLSAKKRQAAEYFLAHPDHVAFMSLRKVAPAARVSPGLVMKLLHDLGYQSYEDFKADFQRLVTGRYQYFSTTAQTATKASQKMSLLDQIAANDIENIRRAVAASKDSNLHAAAPAIVGARKVFVMGKRVSACTALYIAYQLSFIRGEVVLLDNANGMLVDSLSYLGPEDVLIAMSFYPYAVSTVSVVQHAAGKGAKVIALTDRESSPIAMNTDLTFFFPTDNPWVYNSIIASLSLAQALVTESFVVSGKEGLRRINEREQMLQAFTVFE